MPRPDPAGSTSLSRREAMRRRLTTVGRGAFELLVATIDGAPKVDRPADDVADIATYLMGMTEPPEATLAVLEEARKVEEEKVVDWMKLEY